MSHSYIVLRTKNEVKETLSRDCDGCSQLKACNRRYEKVAKGGKVFCPDGTAHLVDQATLIQEIGLVEQQMEVVIE